MPILLETPIEKPAVPATNYTELYIRDLNIRSHNVGEGSLHIEMAPFDPDTGQMDPSERVTVRRSDLFALAAQIPEVAEAMGAVYAAIPKIQEFIAQEEAEEELPE